MEHVTGAISHRSVGRLGRGGCCSVHLQEVKKDNAIIAVEPSTVTLENFQVLWNGDILKRKKQEILLFSLMVCLYHEQHNRNFEKQLSSLMSGGAGPPHFQSPDFAFVFGAGAV